MQTLSLIEAAAFVDLPPIALERLRDAGRGPRFIICADEIRYPFEELDQWNDLVRRFWITEEYKWTMPLEEREDKHDFSTFTPEDLPVVRLSQVSSEFAAEIRGLADEGYFEICSMNDEPVAAVEDLEFWFVAVTASSWED